MISLERWLGICQPSAIYFEWWWYSSGAKTFNDNIKSLNRYVVVFRTESNKDTRIISISVTQMPFILTLIYYSNAHSLHSQTFKIINNFQHLPIFAKYFILDIKQCSDHAFLVLVFPCYFWTNIYLFIKVSQQQVFWAKLNFFTVNYFYRSYY